MTQASSNKSKSAAWHNAENDIRDNLKLMVIIFALHFAAMPLLIISAVTKILTSGSNDFDAFIFVAALSTCLAAGAGMICALSTFKYLYSKPSVDMKLGLPMTTSQRFLSDFFSGLFVYIIPYLLSAVFTWALMFMGHVLCDGKFFTFEASSYDRTNTPITWKCDLFETAAPYLWRGMIGGLLLMVMFYIVSVLVACCCGSLFECIAYNILLNVLVPGAYFGIVYGVCDGICGLYQDFYLSKVLPYLGPVGGVYGVVYALQNVDPSMIYDFNAECSVQFGEWAVIYTVVIALLGLLTGFVYGKRQAEDTGKPVVYSILYHIVMTLGVFFLTFCFISVIGSYAPVIFITVICYLTLHIIRNRGFNHFLKGVVLCAVTTAASVGSYSVISNTSAFGAMDYVPDPAEVTKVFTSYDGNVADNLYGYGIKMIELDDPAQIECITLAHKALTKSIIKQGNSTEIDGNDTLQFSRNFYISYKLKSGKTVYRRYYYLTSEAARELAKIDGETEIRQAKASAVKERILRIRESIEQREKNEMNFDRSSEVFASLFPIWRYRSSQRNGDFADKTVKWYDELPSDFIERLADCIYEDIINEPIEQINTPDCGEWIFSMFTSGCIVKGCYENTIAYLDECGFGGLPEMSSGIVNTFAGQENGICMCSTELMEYITGEDYFITAGSPPATYVWINSESVISPMYFAQAYNYDDDLFELMRNSYKVYKTDRNCYTINVNGNHAVIPEEYNGLAEKVYIRLVYERALALAERGVWEDTAAFVYSGGDENAYAYSFFMTKFLEYYGHDRIISALEGYCEKLDGGADPEEMYSFLVSCSEKNTDVNGAYAIGA